MPSYRCCLTSPPHPTPQNLCKTPAGRLTSDVSTKRKSAMPSSTCWQPRPRREFIICCTGQGRQGEGGVRG